MTIRGNNARHKYGEPLPIPDFNKNNEVPVELVNGLSKGPWCESGESWRRGEWAKSARDRAVVGVMGKSGMSASPLKTIDTISTIIWREA